MVGRELKFDSRSTTRDIGVDEFGKHVGISSSSMFPFTRFNRMQSLVFMKYFVEWNSNSANRIAESNNNSENRSGNVILQAHPGSGKRTVMDMFVYDVFAKNAASKSTTRKGPKVLILGAYEGRLREYCENRLTRVCHVASGMESVGLSGNEPESSRSTQGIRVEYMTFPSIFDKYGSSSGGFEFDARVGEFVNKNVKKSIEHGNELANLSEKYEKADIILGLPLDVMFWMLKKKKIFNNIELVCLDHAMFWLESRTKLIDRPDWQTALEYIVATMKNSDKGRKNQLGNSSGFIGSAALAPRKTITNGIAVTNGGVAVSTSEKTVRFLALTFPVANLQVMSKWLGSASVFTFDVSYSAVAALDMSVVPLNYASSTLSTSKSTMDTLERYVNQAVGRRNLLIFVPSNTRKLVENVADNIVTSHLKKYQSSGDDEEEEDDLLTDVNPMRAYLQGPDNELKDQKLIDLLDYGVAVLHDDTYVSDIGIINEFFKKKQIRILVAGANYALQHRLGFPYSGDPKFLNHDGNLFWSAKSLGADIVIVCGIQKTNLQSYTTTIANISSTLFDTQRFKDFLMKDPFSTSSFPFLHPLELVSLTSSVGKKGVVRVFCAPGREEEYVKDVCLEKYVVKTPLDLSGTIPGATTNSFWDFLYPLICQNVLKSQSDTVDCIKDSYFYKQLEANPRLFIHLLEKEKQNPLLNAVPNVEDALRFVISKIIAKWNTGGSRDSKLLKKTDDLFEPIDNCAYLMLNYPDLSLSTIKLLAEMVRLKTTNQLEATIKGLCCAVELISWCEVRNRNELYYCRCMEYDANLFFLPETCSSATGAGGNTGGGRGGATPAGGDKKPNSKKMMHFPPFNGLPLSYVGSSAWCTGRNAGTGNDDGDNLQSHIHHATQANNSTSGAGGLSTLSFPNVTTAAGEKRVRKVFSLLMDHLASVKYKEANSTHLADDCDGRQTCLYLHQDLARIIPIFNHLLEILQSLLLRNQDGFGLLNVLKLKRGMQRRQLILEGLDDGSNDSWDLRQFLQILGDEENQLMKDVIDGTRKDNSSPLFFLHNWKDVVERMKAQDIGNLQKLGDIYGYLFFEMKPRISAILAALGNTGDAKTSFDNSDEEAEIHRRVSADMQKRFEGVTKLPAEIATFLSSLAKIVYKNKSYSLFVNRAHANKKASKTELFKLATSLQLSVVNCVGGITMGTNGVGQDGGQQMGVAQKVGMKGANILLHRLSITNVAIDDDQKMQNLFDGHRPLSSNFQVREVGSKSIGTPGPANTLNAGHTPHAKLPESPLMLAENSIGNNVVIEKAEEILESLFAPENYLLLAYDNDGALAYSGYLASLLLQKDGKSGDGETTDAIMEHRALGKNPSPQGILEKNAITAAVSLSFRNGLSIHLLNQRWQGFDLSLQIAKPQGNQLENLKNAVVKVNDVTKGIGKIEDKPVLQTNTVINTGGNDPPKLLKGILKKPSSLSVPKSAVPLKDSLKESETVPAEPIVARTEENPIEDEQTDAIRDTEKVNDTATKLKTNSLLGKRKALRPILKKPEPIVAAVVETIESEMIAENDPTEMNQSETPILAKPRPPLLGRRRGGLVRPALAKKADPDSGKTNDDVAEKANDHPETLAAADAGDAADAGGGGGAANIDRDEGDRSPKSVKKPFKSLAPRRNPPLVPARPPQVSSEVKSMEDDVGGKEDDLQMPKQDSIDTLQAMEPQTFSDSTNSVKPVEELGGIGDLANKLMNDKLAVKSAPSPEEHADILFEELVCVPSQQIVRMVRREDISDPRRDPTIGLLHKSKPVAGLFIPDNTAYNHDPVAEAAEQARLEGEARIEAIMNGTYKSSSPFKAKGKSGCNSLWKGKGKSKADTKRIDTVANMERLKALNADQPSCSCGLQAVRRTMKANKKVFWGCFKGPKPAGGCGFFRMWKGQSEWETIYESDSSVYDIGSYGKGSLYGNGSFYGNTSTHDKGSGKGSSYGNNSSFTANSFDSKWNGNSMGGMNQTFDTLDSSDPFADVDPVGSPLGKSNKTAKPTMSNAAFNARYGITNVGEKMPKKPSDGIDPTGYKTLNNFLPTERAPSTVGKNLSDENIAKRLKLDSRMESLMAKIGSSSTVGASAAAAVSNLPAASVVTTNAPALAVVSTHTPEPPVGLSKPPPGFVAGEFGMVPQSQFGATPKPVASTIGFGGGARRVPDSSGKNLAESLLQSQFGSAQQQAGTTADAQYQFGAAKPQFEPTKTQFGSGPAKSQFGNTFTAGQFGKSQFGNGPAKSQFDGGVAKPVSTVIDLTSGDITPGKTATSLGGPFGMGSWLTNPKENAIAAPKAVPRVTVVDLPDSDEEDLSSMHSSDSPATKKRKLELKPAISSTTFDLLDQPPSVSPEKPVESEKEKLFAAPAQLMTSAEKCPLGSFQDNLTRLRHSGEMGVNFKGKDAVTRPSDMSTAPDINRNSNGTATDSMRNSMSTDGMRNSMSNENNDVNGRSNSMSADVSGRSSNMSTDVNGNQINGNDMNGVPMGMKGDNINGMNEASTNNVQGQKTPVFERPPLDVEAKPDATVINSALFVCQAINETPDSGRAVCNWKVPDRKKDSGKKNPPNLADIENNGQQSLWQFPELRRDPMDDVRSEVDMRSQVDSSNFGGSSMSGGGAFGNANGAFADGFFGGAAQLNLFAQVNGLGSNPKQGSNQFNNLRQVNQGNDVNCPAVGMQNETKNGDGINRAKNPGINIFQLPLCFCNRPVAFPSVVQKDGPNRGKMIYKCATAVAQSKKEGSKFFKQKWKGKGGKEKGGKGKGAVTSCGGRNSISMQDELDIIDGIKGSKGERKFTNAGYQPGKICHYFCMAPEGKWVPEKWVPDFLKIVQEKPHDYPHLVGKTVLTNEDITSMVPVCKCDRLCKFENTKQTIAGVPPNLYWCCIDKTHEGGCDFQEFLSTVKRHDDGRPPPGKNQCTKPVDGNLASTLNGPGADNMNGYGSYPVGVVALNNNNNDSTMNRMTHNGERNIMNNMNAKNSMDNMNGSNFPSAGSGAKTGQVTNDGNMMVSSSSKLFGGDVVSRLRNMLAKTNAGAHTNANFPRPESIFQQRHRFESNNSTVNSERNFGSIVPSPASSVPVSNGGISLVTSSDFDFLVAREPERTNVYATNFTIGNKFTNVNSRIGNIQVADNPARGPCGSIMNHQPIGNNDKKAPTETDRLQPDLFDFHPPGWKPSDNARKQATVVESQVAVSSNRAASSKPTASSKPGVSSKPVESPRPTTSMRPSPRPPAPKSGANAPPVMSMKPLDINQLLPGKNVFEPLKPTRPLVREPFVGYEEVVGDPVKLEQPKAQHSEQAPASTFSSIIQALHNATRRSDRAETAIASPPPARGSPGLDSSVGTKLSYFETFKRNLSSGLKASALSKNSDEVDKKKGKSRGEKAPHPNAEKVKTAAASWRCGSVYQDDNAYGRSCVFTPEKRVNNGPLLVKKTSGSTNNGGKPVEPVQASTVNKPTEPEKSERQATASSSYKAAQPTSSVPASTEKNSTATEDPLRWLKKAARERLNLLEKSEVEDACAEIIEALQSNSNSLLRLVGFDGDLQMEVIRRRAELLEAHRLDPIKTTSENWTVTEVLDSKEAVSRSAEHRELLMQLDKSNSNLIKPGHLTKPTILQTTSKAMNEAFRKAPNYADHHKPLNRDNWFERNEATEKENPVETADVSSKDAVASSNNLLNKDKFVSQQVVHPTRKVTTAADRLCEDPRFAALREKNLKLQPTCRCGTKCIQAYRAKADAYFWRCVNGDKGCGFREKWLDVDAPEQVHPFGSKPAARLVEPSDSLCAKNDTSNKENEVPNSIFRNAVPSKKISPAKPADSSNKISPPADSLNKISLPVSYSKESPVTNTNLINARMDKPRMSGASSMKPGLGAAAASQTIPDLTQAGSPPMCRCPVPQLTRKAKARGGIYYVCHLSGRIDSCKYKKKICDLA